MKQNGVILIPAFTVGRAQTLMYYLSLLKRQNRIADIPIYLNSPMATNVSNLFHKYRGDHKLTPAECDDMCGVVEYVRSVEESKALNEKHGPMIIISASGMLTGGRILHHLDAFAPDPRNAIILSGFQAAGTRGRLIQDGAREIKMHGHLVPIRAKVYSLENLSAHGDYSEILSWLKSSNIRPKRVFVTHGEPSSSESLKNQIAELFSWRCEVPTQDQEFTLE